MAVRQAVLTYEAVRADNKTDGMVYMPVWDVIYQDEAAVKHDYTDRALFNAVDGSLIDASFR